MESISNMAVLEIPTQPPKAYNPNIEKQQFTVSAEFIAQ
jgi:hypothetical protein